MSRRKLLLATLALLLSPLVHAAPWPAVVDHYVAAQKQGLPSITMQQLKAKLDKGLGRALLIDVREPAEFERAHIPGAINIPRGVLEFRVWKVLGSAQKPDLDRPIYTYCSLGGRAALSARALRALGLRHVTYVDMKLADWQKKGYPLE